MKDKKSKARKIIGILCLTIGSIVVLLLPYIVEHFYYNIDPPNGFFAVKYDVKDLLTYYERYATLHCTFKKFLLQYIRQVQQSE